MSEIYRKLKGFADMFGEQSALFAKMESAARQTFVKYGYEELRTPILEQTALFQRSIGTETDVVQKEMFTFPDRKERSLTLRPEATAGVMRAYIEAGLDNAKAVSRFFTMGPMFRYERPQKGRMRQFHQINCECLGSDSPYADADIICMLLEFLSCLKISDLKLKLNSLGCKICRPAYLAKLKSYLEDLPQENFCNDCRKRIYANPLRVLDCKEAQCRELTANAPRLLDNNCPACRNHIDKVIDLLEKRHIEIEIDHHLVRGLDYYSRTTFEIVSNKIGSQTAVAGGGRYDGLIQQLGGQDVPGIGFACGMERLALLMDPAPRRVPDFYMIAMDTLDRAFEIVEDLRLKGFSGEMSFNNASFKSMIRQAAKTGARFCLILGQDESIMDEITIKNMETGTQKRVRQNLVAEELGKLLNNN